MQIPLRVVWRNLDPMPAVEAEIDRHVAHLEEFSDRITGCRITIDRPHRHRQQGSLYHVVVHLTVPAGELVVRRSPDERHSHEDVLVALKDAFDAARRRLQDWARKRESRPRSRARNPEGRVAALFRPDGYGFIRTRDGRDVYFNRESVLGDAFDDLTEGSVVSFAEEVGSDGPQASTVRFVRAGPVVHDSGVS